jgi:hypothetical protein
MKNKQGYKSIPLSINRKMVIASIAINKKSALPPTWSGALP